MSGHRLRTILVLAVLGAAVAKAMGLFRSPPAPSISGHPTLGGGPLPGGPTEGRSPGAVDRPTPAAAPITAPTATAPTATAPLVEAGTVERAATDGAWVAPVEGACPDGYPVKAKLRSGIYHLPGTAAYERTIPDRCYASADAATSDGLRPAKR